MGDAMKKMIKPSGVVVDVDEASLEHAQKLGWKLKKEAQKSVKKKDD